MILAALLRQYAFPKINLMLFTLAYSIAFFMCVYSMKKIYDYHTMNRPCKHMYKGGLNKGCPACVSEQKAENERLKKIQEEIDRKKYIKDFARLVYDEEIQKVYQHNFKSLDYLQNTISPREFEVIVGKLFVAQGYEVEQTPYVNDGGKDLIVKKNGIVYFVECKQHSDSNSVGRPLLQKLVGAMHGQASKGFFVTTSTFANTAYSYAKEANIELIDQNKLMELYRKHFQTNDISTNQVVCLECGEVVEFIYPSHGVIKKCSKGHNVTNNLPEHVTYYPRTPKGSSSIVVCRLCGSSMRVIKGKRGKFWGCSRYPGCRFTMNYK